MIGSLWGDLDGIPERSGQITGETGVHSGPAFPAGFPGRPASVVRLPHLPLTRSPLTGVRQRGSPICIRCGVLSR